MIQIFEKNNGFVFVTLFFQANSVSCFLKKTDRKMMANSKNGVASM